MTRRPRAVRAEALRNKPHANTDRRWYNSVMQPGGMVRLLIAAGVLATVTIATPTARAAGDPADPGGPTATTLRAELGRRSERVTARADADVLAFVGGAADLPLQTPGVGGPTAAARRFVDRYAPAFGAADPADLAAPDVERTPAGDGVRFQQEHDGVTVLGGQMSVQLGRDGAVLSASGRIAPALKLDVTPAVTADDAAATAVALTAKAEQVDAGLLTATTPEIAIFDPSLWGIDDARGARLVWSTAARTELGDVNRFVLVDALDGTIALDFDQVHAGRQRLVCDRNNNPLDPPPCTNPVRVEGQAPTAVTDVNQAYDFAGVTYDYYFNVLGRDSVDGNGLPLRSTVRVCVQGEACPFVNAYWDNVLNQMFYGEGYAAADDVVAHELTHGVTNFTSRLFYYAQSGAINESLSDVFGELVDRSTPDGDPAWLQGEDIAGGAVRDMSNPPAFNHPDRMRSPLYHLQPGDSGGVHINSGVSNKAAFLMVSGGTFNGQTVTAIGDVKTAHVYYLAQTTMLTALSQYSDLAVMLPQACRNLIGQHGIVETDCQQVDKAVLATEMHLTPDSPALTVPSACASGAMVRNATLAADTQTNPAAWQFTSTVPGLAPEFRNGTVPGNRVLFVPEHRGVGDVTARWQQPITVPAGETILTVKHLYAMEADWDGGVIEYTTDGTTWQDLQAAVGSGNVVNGYDDTVQSGSLSHPLRLRPVFSGQNLGFTVSRYQLAPLAGQTIRLRFRVGSDDSVSVFGWLIDDISVSTCGAALAPAAPVATLSGSDVTLTWAPPASTSPITGYRIVALRSGVPQAPVTVGPVGTHTLPGLPGGLYTFTVAAITGVGAEPASPPSNTVALNQPFAPLTPARVLETRPGLSTTDGLFNGIGLLGPGTVTAVTVAGRAGVPGDASAVALNVTVTDARGPGFVTVFPCGVASVPNASNLNYGAGSTVPNMVVAKVGAGGQVCVFTPTTTHLLIDVNGFFPAATAFTPIVPVRVLETRPGLATGDGLLAGIGPRDAGTVTEVPIAGRAGIPGDAAAVVLNVTVTGTQAPGFATVYPCGGTVPTASNLNHGVGATVPNATVTKIGANGSVCIFTVAATHLLVDVNGWFPQGADVTPLVPARLLESRPGLVTDDAQFNGIGLRQPGVVTSLQVTGRGGVPNGATAVALNVTVTETQSPGFVTVFPCDGTPPTASNLNFGVGTTVANAVLAKVGPGGQVCFYSLAAHHLLVDVNGYVTG